MGRAVGEEASCAATGVEEARTRQQREMARLWMALHAVRQAEASAPQPRATPPALAIGGSARPGAERHLA
jgi:hypothetical protein